jgi:hypothetical protein
VNQRRASVSQLGEGLRLRGDAEVGHDRREPFGGDLGADVVEEDGGEAVFGDRREDQRDEAAARGADDDDAVEPEMVEEGYDVGGLAAGVVVEELGVAVGGAPAAEGEPDQPVAALERGGEVVEVGVVAGEAGEAEEGEAPALVAVGEGEAVGGQEALHSRYSG